MLFLLAAFFHILTKRRLAKFSLTKEREVEEEAVRNSSFRGLFLLKKILSFCRNYKDIYLVVTLSSLFSTKPYVSASYDSPCYRWGPNSGGE